MSECTNPEIGLLIHFFELQALSEEDEKRFEEHLLECDYCFREVGAFEKYAHLLHDADLRDTLRSRLADSSNSGGLRRTSLWGKLWPHTPLAFRPGLLYLLILLLIWPAYLGVKGFLLPGIGKVTQQVTFYATLDETEQMAEFTFYRSLGGIGTLNFDIPFESSDSIYTVRILDESGRNIYGDDQMKGLGTWGIGSISLADIGSMKPGRYCLRVSVSQPTDSVRKIEYFFWVE